MKMISNLLSVAIILLIMVVIFRSPVAINRLSLLIGLESTPIELADNAYGIIKKQSDVSGYSVAKTNNIISIECVKFKDVECIGSLMSYVANFNYVAALNRLPPPKNLRWNPVEKTLYIVY